MPTSPARRKASKATIAFELSFFSINGVVVSMLLVVPSLLCAFLSVGILGGYIGRFLLGAFTYLVLAIFSDFLLMILSFLRWNCLCSRLLYRLRSVLQLL